MHPINEVVFRHIILADSMFRGVAGLFQCLVFHEVPLPRVLRGRVWNDSCHRGAGHVSCPPPYSEFQVRVKYHINVYDKEMGVSPRPIL